MWQLTPSTQSRVTSGTILEIRQSNNCNIFFTHYAKRNLIILNKWLDVNCKEKANEPTTFNLELSGKWLAF